MVQARNLCKLFRGRRALDGVSFDVGAGAKCAVLGGNGAGKSTLLKIFAGVVPPTSGSASIGGEEVFFAPPGLRSGIGYMPEDIQLYPDMRIREHLKFAGKLRGMDNNRLTRRMHDVLSLCELAPHRDTVISRLSHGERRRVALAATLLHEPALLILDDPIAGLDENNAAKIISLISDPSLSATTILFSTHSRDLAAVATQTLKLVAGKLDPADSTELSSLRDS